MKYVIIGIILVILSIGLIRYSSIIGAIMLLVGLIIMVKGKNKIDNK